ncbi:hypothetical protein Godav_004498 [Gossypium davidsonii]|uniref:non-specific serine/threonine protein kinase n=1 Tax=Gossypium davidsonii TaxID=34287 RepID=A0A7J8SLE0_GOSDV|nr:hypothetical protein [Gossypium davidsonii]
MLDWPMRLRICIGITKGLAFLHDDCPLRIVHRDIKATNVLLEKDLSPKISDFGLELSSYVCRGYMAPEYALWGYLTYKADVYSFGVIALEIFARKNNMKYQANENFICLLDWVRTISTNFFVVSQVEHNILFEYSNCLHSKFKEDIIFHH